MISVKTRRRIYTPKMDIKFVVRDILGLVDLLSRDHRDEKIIRIQTQHLREEMDKWGKSV